MDNLVQARSSSKTYNCTHKQSTPFNAMNNSPRALFYHKENDGKEEKETSRHYFVHLHHLQ